MHLIVGTRLLTTREKEAPWFPRCDSCYNTGLTFQNPVKPPRSLSTRTRARPRCATSSSCVPTARGPGGRGWRWSCRCWSRCKSWQSGYQRERHSGKAALDSYVVLNELELLNITTLAHHRASTRGVMDKKRLEANSSWVHLVALLQSWGSRFGSQGSWVRKSTVRNNAIKNLLTLALLRTCRIVSVVVVQ